MYRNDTRDKIMARISEGMHLSGYQGLRTDKVIEALGITKGAFYHYFIDKPTVALAVIDEIHAKNYIATWQGLTDGPEPVLDKLATALEGIKGMVTEENVHLGCPVNNLIQEMAPLEESFRLRLKHIVETELSLISEALVYARDHGQVKSDTKAYEEAMCIINGLEGAYSTGKLFRSKEFFDTSVDQIIAHIRTLAV